MGKLNQDCYVALVLLVVCGIFFWDTFNIRDMEYESMGSEVWPRLILLLVFALSLGLLFQSQRQPPKTPSSGGGFVGWLKRYRNALWCYALFAAFLLTLPFLGMLIGGIVFVFCALTVLGKRDFAAHLRHAAIAVTTIGLMWSIFTFGLRVMLPPGDILNIW